MMSRFKEINLKIVCVSNDNAHIMFLVKKCKTYNGELRVCFAGHIYSQEEEEEKSSMVEWCSGS